MILLFSRAVSLSTLTISRAVSLSTLTIFREVPLISDDLQSCSISDELNDFQSWRFIRLIRLIISRARSQCGFRIRVFGMDSSAACEFVLQLYKLVSENFLELFF